MHIALIIDEERLSQEHSMLNRLCIGLMSEGVQMTRIVPEARTEQPRDDAEQRVGLAARIESPMTALPWTRPIRAKRLAEALDRALPDVIYALGEKAWQLGADLAARIDKPLLLDVCSLAQARTAPRPQDQITVTGYIVPCTAIASALEQRVDKVLINLVPLGVTAPSQPGQPLSRPDQMAAIAILGAGRDLPAYEALFNGLNRVVQQTTAVQIFLELRGPNEHAIWRKAQQLELISYISAISHAGAYRSLLAGCDMVLLPERSDEARSVVLEAMALGVPIIALADPILDMLIDGQTASVMARADAEQWRERILDFLLHPDHARSLGLSVRKAVISHHRSSDHVAKLIQSLEKSLSGGAYRFTGRPR